MHENEIYDDIKIIEDLGMLGSNHYYLVECLKCGRRKKMSASKLFYPKNRRGTEHKWCVNQIEFTKHFHSKWTKMRDRTNNPNNIRYKYYGGRGISSDAWKYFIDFYDDMYESYLEHVKEYGEKETTLDRINPNDNYYKNNCKWSTLSEQNGNTTRNRTFEAISPNGVIFYSKNQSEFAREHNLYRKCINDCLLGKNKTHKGWIFRYIN